jgi:hypothetical protein
MNWISRSTPRKKHVSYKRAVLQLQKTGTRLCQMHKKGGQAWYLIPGGEISDETAHKLLMQPNVIGQDDALFPGLHQTWIVRAGDKRL